MKNLKLFLILIVVVNFSACKINQTQNQSQLVSGIGGIEIQSERNFNSDELDILKRVCSMLKAKREFFTNLGNMEEKFKFNLKNSNCDGGVYSDFDSNAWISNSNSTDLEYVFEGINYNSNILNDQTVGIKNLCDQANSNVIKNRYSTDKNIYAYNFYILKGYDIFEMSRLNKDSNVENSLKSSEKIAFITQASQAPTKFLGVEKERIKNVVCAPGKFSTTTQTWLGAITSF